MAKPLQVLDVNLKSVWLLSQAAARHMLPLRRGKIINFCSLLTYQGGLTVPAYAAAKGALGQLTKALSNEWSKHNVHVNGIVPGYIATDMSVPHTFSISPLIPTVLSIRELPATNRTTRLSKLSPAHLVAPHSIISTPRAFPPALGHPSRFLAFLPRLMPFYVFLPPSVLSTDPAFSFFPRFAPHFFFHLI